MATYEMNMFKKEYQQQIRKNARAYAQALKNSGIDVEGDESDGFTDTHQVVIRISKFGDGMDLARRLEENNIVTNYQALPDDETFLKASGIRMGVQEMTRFGMKEGDFQELSQLVADVIIKNTKVKEKVSKFRSRFLDMHFCLPAQQAAPFAAKVFSSIFPKIDFFKKFVDNLQNSTQNM